MNSIQLAAKYQPLLDEVYKKASLTQDLETAQVKFDGVATVKILKLQVPTLGSYSRNSGFTSGDVTAVWEDWTLTQDRGREFNIDAVDNEQTLDMTFGAASKEFIRLSVVPQIDTYRFAKLASKSGITVKAEDLATGDDVIAAITAANSTLSEDEVPDEDRILYITPTLKALVDGVETYKSKEVINKFSKIVEVPSSRFFSKAKYNTATEEIEKDTGAKNINFMIVQKSAVQATAQHVRLRIFLADGDEGTGANRNQNADAHKFQYRIVHDINVYDNKVAGIYCHTKA